MLKPLFRNPKGKWKIDDLFYERLQSFEKDKAIYTLNSEDKVLSCGKVLPSLYRLYMELEDIHEVEFSRTYLGGYEHWKRVSTSVWFSEYIRAWREELELSLMSRGLRVLKSALTSEKMSDATFAAKFFSNRGWDEGIHKNSHVNASRGKGRPSNKGLQNTLTTEPTTISSDFKRLLNG